MPIIPRIFISYSHADEIWKDRLVMHLAVLGDQIDVWDDRRIDAGEDWLWKIQGAMTSAAVAVLLVSKDFLTSRFILDEEVPRILERHGSGLWVVPVIVHPCIWQRVPWLAPIQARPRGGEALGSMADAAAETALADLAEEIAAGLLNETKKPIRGRAVGPRVLTSRLPVTGEHFFVSCVANARFWCSTDWSLSSILPARRRGASRTQRFRPWCGNWR